MISLLLSCVAQDLIDRSTPKKPPPKAEAKRTEPKQEGVRRVPFPRDLEAGSVAVADFLAPLISEEEEVMRVLMRDPEKWLARSGLTLLCQASPTLCNVFKHLRANANAARETVQETIRSLESRVPGFEAVSRSEILRECVREAIAKGENPAAALRACYSTDRLKDALGEWRDKLDLGHEIARRLGLDPAQTSLLREMLRPVAITSKGLEIVDRPSPLQRRFRNRVAEWTGRWREAIEDPRRVTRETLQEMARIGLSDEDLGRMAAVADWMKERVVASIASAVSRVEIEDEAAQLDGWLATLDGSVDVPEYLKGPARQLRAESRADLESIRREAETALRLQRAVTALRDDVDRELASRLAARMELLMLRADSARLRRDAREWGSLPK